MENPKDDDNSSRSGSSRGRGGRHNRTSYYNNSVSNSLQGGRAQGHQPPEVRGTFRFRNPDEIAQEIEPESVPVEERRRDRHHRGPRQGYYSLNDGSQSRSSGGRRHHRSHHHQEDNHEDPIVKEKQRHKLSLLDGIEEILKKTGPEKPSSVGELDQGASANNSGASNDENHLNEKVKKLEDDDSYDGSEKNSRYPYKSYSRDGHRHKHGHCHGKEGSFRPKGLAEEDDIGFNSNGQNDHRRDRHQPRSFFKPRIDRGQEAFESYNTDRSHRGRHNRKYNEAGSEDKGEPSSYRGHRKYHDDRSKLVDDNPDMEMVNGAVSKPRFGRNQHPRNKVYPSAPKIKAIVDEDATQRERLTEQLESRDFECMVCCETVRHRDPIWNCIKCFNIFHLGCIGKWARTPTAIVEGAGWRCPTCQDIYEKIPTHYYCFCGHVRDPELSRHDTPHSCGNVCNRNRQIKGCAHLCNILCHPGPCPPCSTMVTRKCECGKIEMSVRCGRAKSLTCDGICEKLLNCGAHKCKIECHPGPCPPCDSIVPQKCYCSKSSREVACTEESSNSSRFICDEVCNKKLACNEHDCDLYCHDGECPPCQLLPSIVKTCHCGRNSVIDILVGKNREKCTDPIPTCGKDCLKVLSCGPQDEPHKCYSKCHPDKCPPCPLKTEVRCRCGNLVESIACAELENSSQLTCERRCNKKKHCGRHKCLNWCCVDTEHLCELTCNRMLSCSLHRCPELCHKGNCRTCSNVSFEDLYCDCGTQMVMAPVACGKKPPECDQLCMRDHACDHAVQHNCHSEEICPPCTAFTEKYCFGGHEKRSHVPCFLESLSCGRPCSKPLSCGQHVCQKTCHEGLCQPEDQETACTQPCPKKRPDCEHPCAAPCHQGQCFLDNACKTMIPLSCECGTRSEKVPCGDNVRLFKQVSASLLASKMHDIQLGNSVDISDVLGTSNIKKNKLGKLDCNEECSTVDRNRRLALALQIRNPDLSANPGPPKYSDFLKEEFKKNRITVIMIYDKLVELVQLAKQSKQKSRSHSFQPMNRDHRRVVHELAEFFGCDTVSFDQEPKRNVVITAFRDRSYLPSNSVMVVVEREMGMRKAPPPLLSGGANTATSTTTTTSKPPETSTSNKQNVEKVIDYFDF